MHPVLVSIGTLCIALSLLLEAGSYYKQIAKTLRTKKSAQVSSSAFVLKIAKYVVTILGLVIYANWVAVGIEVAALTFCIIALYIICKYKPKGWTLWGRVKHAHKKSKPTTKHRHVK